MRIIAGEFKGRIITTVKDLSVRPATDRVRQTIFDMLTTRLVFEGARVLDLFAGSGSLGLEALSRGAEHATFVETGAEAIRYLEKNITALGLDARTQIAPMDALAFIRSRPAPFELVFADPPYAFTETAQLPSLLFSGSFISPGGYLLIEHASALHFTEGPSYNVTAEKKFGRTIVTFFQKKEHP